MTAKSADRTAHGAQDAAVVAARSATQGPRRDPAAHPRRQQPRQPAPHLRPETRIRAIPALIRPAAQAQVPVEPAVMAATVQVPRAMPAATAPPPAGPVPATPQAGPAVNNPLTPICVCRRSDPRECRQTVGYGMPGIPACCRGVTARIAVSSPQERRGPGHRIATAAGPTYYTRSLGAIQRSERLMAEIIAFSELVMIEESMPTPQMIWLSPSSPIWHST